MQRVFTGRRSHYLLMTAGCLLCVCLSALHPADAGPLHVYTESTRPLQYEEDGELKGFTVEVVREIMLRAGSQGVMEIVPWKRGYLEAHDEPDVVLFPTYRTPEREEDFQWVGPIFKTEWVLYKKKGSPLRLASLEDARKIGTISVYGSDARHLFLQEHGFTNLQVVKDNKLGWQMLLSGRVDLVAGSNLVYTLPEGQYDAPLSEVEPALVMAEFLLHPVFSRKADPALVQSWRVALGAMVEDGTYATIYRRYFDMDVFSPYPLDPAN